MNEKESLFMDELNRKPLANTIISLIRNYRLTGSIRVGIYGRWGEGKTTALKYIKELAHTNNYKVASFNPWNAQNFVDLWCNFYACILEEAFKEPTNQKKWDIKSLTTKAIPVFSKIPYLEKAIGNLPDLALPLILSTIKLDIKKRLDKEPTGTKLIIIIDDLDRATPKLVPHLLLGLLEELDLNRCAYVFGLDPVVIAKALPSVHPGWGTTAEFLEKIIEFRFWLPPPEREQLLRLCENAAKESPLQLDEHAIAEILDLLPSNPRKLKQFFRGIWRLKDQLDRHEGKEIQWTLLLMLEYLRSMSFEVSNLLVDTQSFWDQLLGSVFRTSLEETEGSPLPEEEWAITLRKIVDRASDIGDTEAKQKLSETLINFFNAFKERIGPEHFQNIRYWARLSEEPPVFTWKEFDQFLENWRLDPSAN